MSILRRQIEGSNHSISTWNWPYNRFPDLDCSIYLQDLNTDCVCRYAFSFDVAQKLHELNSIAPLKLMPNEDATFGFWVMGMQLRHIAHPKVRAAAGGCCFYV